MLPRERKSASHVGFAVKERRLEILRAVARGTIRASRPRCELPLVRVLVTVLTEFVRDRAPEIVFFVAFPAGHLRMLPDQAKLRGVVTEIPGGATILPAAGVVAAVAPAAEFYLLKCPAMGIGVTALAVAEGQPFKKKRLLRRIAVSAPSVALHLADSWRIAPGMTFLAQNLLMQATERKGRAGMAEPGSGFPGLLVVAVEAVSAEPGLMRILVARSTLAPQSKKGPVGVSFTCMTAEAG